MDLAWPEDLVLRLLEQLEREKAPVKEQKY